MTTDEFCHLFDQSENDSRSISMNDFNAADYLPHLDGLDMTDDQKAELMLVVWDIMRMWVEMDLPVQSCGHLVQSLIDPPCDKAAVVE
jgi:hypothetical protein